MNETKPQGEKGECGAKSEDGIRGSGRKWLELRCNDPAVQGPGAGAAGHNRERSAIWHKGVRVMEPLPNCPCCDGGADVDAIDYDYEKGFQVSCCNCGLHTITHHTREAALAAWSARAATPQPTADPVDAQPQGQAVAPHVIATCPDCGGVVDMWHDLVQNTHHVACSKRGCPVNLKVSAGTAEAALAAWPAAAPIAEATGTSDAARAKRFLAMQSLARDPATAPAMLESLRWTADRLITNHEGERVWLKPCYDENDKRIGITDCCAEESPCFHHLEIAGELARKAGTLKSDPVEAQPQSGAVRVLEWSDSAYEYQAKSNHGEAIASGCWWRERARKKGAAKWGLWKTTYVCCPRTNFRELLGDELAAVIGEVNRAE